MRTIFLALALSVTVGCAETEAGRRNHSPDSPGQTPVVSERPTIFERLKFNRQQRAEHQNVGLTRVQGNVTR